MANGPTNSLRYLSSKEAMLFASGLGFLAFLGLSFSMVPAAAPAVAVAPHLFDILIRSLHRRAMITCQWFFTALSVRPGKSLAITAHRFPWTRCEARSSSSSSSEKGLRLILGSSWLNHLSLQLFPETNLSFSVKLLINYAMLLRLHGLC